MIELQRSLCEPTELSRFRASYSQPSWNQPAFQAIRAIIRRQLNQEQEELCIYCERQLPADEGHIDHIKPKNSNPTLTFEYSNLAHSCDGPGHCGHHKGNRAIPVEPCVGCNRFFTLISQDGKLVPALGLTSREVQQAKETLELLGLNAVALARDRKKYIDIIKCLSSPNDIEEFIATSQFRWLLRGLTS